MTFPDLVLVVVIARLPRFGQSTGAGMRNSAASGVASRYSLLPCTSSCTGLGAGVGEGVWCLRSDIVSVSECVLRLLEWWMVGGEPGVLYLRIVPPRSGEGFP